ncbi:TPA: hypothetical protein KPG57_001636 [Clostridioides difficile]|nr:hypothetical protein [Clostridioides difficile]
MNRGNRIIYDDLGKIWMQTGEATGDILPHDKITKLSYIDIEYGSVDYSKQYIECINIETKEPVLKNIPLILTEEEKRIQELENQLLLSVNQEIGGGIL